MKKILFLVAVILSASYSQSQTISIVEPEGLVEPYEVAPGTQVTFMFDHYGEPPTTIFSDNQEPEFPSFGTDPNWNQSTNYTDNGDGTYNFTLTVNEELWVFAGYYQSMLSMWAFSNIIHIQTASDVVISYIDGMVCGDGIDFETLTVADQYDSYQWYKDNEIIAGATQNTYEATQAGAYKVQVTQGGEPTFSNTLHITEVEIDITANFSAGSSQITLEATSNFDSYQWFQGSSANDLTPISGEQNQNYTTSLPTQMTYYAVEGTIGSCTVVSTAKPVSAAAFSTPVITINADTNSFGKVCEGTLVSLSANGGYATYKWYQDGFETYNETEIYTLSQSWEQGNYSVEVTPEGWPEVKIESQPVEVTFFTITTPDLITDVSGPYCPEQVVNIILGDEGYDYTWYVHSDYNYSEDDLIENSGAVLELTFENQIYVTVVGSYQGCSASSTTTLFAAANETPYISFVNWDDQYLCTDSSAVIEIGWGSENYSNFQWYKETDGDFVAIDGATSSSYSANQTGKYKLTANIAACSDVVVESNVVEVFDYTDQELFIYADNEEICMDDEVELHISGGAMWQNIQWFKEVIEMGSQGYEKVLQPIVSGIGQPSVTVSELGTYAAKARHESCPTGIKITSNLVDIKPAVNPQISVDPDYGIHNWHLWVLDTIPSYIFCNDEPVGVSVPDEYDFYEWYILGYSGDGGFNLGDQISGANGSSTTVFAGGADWITAKVEQNGCVGISYPVLIDTWVFSPPAIASYSNAELCHEGDSTLLHNAFPGNYAKFEWYLNGQLIPDSNTDSLWAKIPGEYTLTVFREECPEFGMSTGVGPVVSFLDAYILENDTVIYAMPQLGFYDYQWYFNGEPLSYSPAPPWVIYKDQMESGEYTVEVSNPDGCVALSDPYIWTGVGLETINESFINIYPNPSTRFVTLSGVEASEINQIKIYDAVGKLVETIHKPTSGHIDMINLAKGAYVMEVELKDNLSISKKFIKEK